MLTELKDNDTAVLRFLEEIDQKVHSMDELLYAVRSEIQKAEIDNPAGQTDKGNRQDYLKGLKNIESTLSSPSAIKFAFSSNPQGVYSPAVKQRNIESCIFNFIFRFIREGKL